MRCPPRTLQRRRHPARCPPPFLCLPQRRRLCHPVPSRRPADAVRRAGGPEAHHARRRQLDRRHLGRVSAARPGARAAAAGALRPAGARHSDRRSCTRPHTRSLHPTSRPPAHPSARPSACQCSVANGMVPVSKMRQVVDDVSDYCRAHANCMGHLEVGRQGPPGRAARADWGLGAHGRAQRRRCSAGRGQDSAAVALSPYPEPGAHRRMARRARGSGAAALPAAGTAWYAAATQPSVPRPL